MYKVLLVDDEPLIAQNVENVLSREYDVKTLNDPRLALEAAIAFNPDLIILDILMPHIDGFELCQLLRQHPSTKKILIMMLTQLTNQDNVIRGLRSGATVYLGKPPNRDILLGQIKALFEARDYVSALSSVDLSPTEPQRGRKNIFISHDTEDDSFVTVLARLLEELGFNTWFDHKNESETGLEWIKSLEHTLSICDELILIMTPDSMSEFSVITSAEWFFFLKRNKRIHPILLRPCKINWLLERLDYADFTGSSMLALEKLIKTLKR